MSKKIMFNDRYGLTNAVLQGRKTMTRRIIHKSVIDKVDEYQLLYYNQTFDEISFCDALINMNEENMIRSSYKIGEVVAIAQSYNDIYEKLKMTHGSSSYVTRQFFHKYIQGGRMPVSNKMFVRADIMPHQIRITNIRVECLQDISNEDCLKEGVLKREITPFKTIEVKYQVPKTTIYKDTPREAFAALIDKVSGKGTWKSNPWVFVYSFELIK